jgi:hypothetical protein
MKRISGLLAAALVLCAVTASGAYRTLMKDSATSICAQTVIFTAASFTGGVIASSTVATDDELDLVVTTGGANHFHGTISAVDLTAARAWNFPNASGTVAVSASGIVALDALGNITATEAQTLQAVTTLGASTTTLSTFTGGLTLGADDDPSNLILHSASTVVMWDDSDDTSITLGPVVNGTNDLGLTGGLKITLDLEVLGSVNFGKDDDISVVTIHDAGQLTFWDDSDDTSVTIGPVGDGTTVLGVTGTINASGLQVGGAAVLTAEADTLQAVMGRGATSTAAGTIRGLTVDTATANDDVLEYVVTTGGAGHFHGTLSAVDLTGARAWNLPDAGGTVAVSASGIVALSATGNITATEAQDLAAVTALGASTATASTFSGGLLATNATTALTIGAGVAATDYRILFDGETNDGVITWMEDEDLFSMDCQLAVSGMIQTGAGGTDGSLVIYSEQGGTDYSVTIGPHATMTENTAYLLPAAKPGAGTTGILASDDAGNMSWGLSTLVEVDDLASVTARAATTAASLTLTGATPLELGADAATNTGGLLKLWSAGANNYYTVLQTPTQTGNVILTTPTALPPGRYPVELDDDGQMYASGGETTQAVGNIETSVTFDFREGPVKNCTTTTYAVDVDFSNWPAGRAATMVLYLTNGAAVGMTWSGVDRWAGGALPTLTASGIDVVVLFTPDGGTTVVGNVSMTDVKAAP